MSTGEFGDLEQPYDFQNIPHYRGGNRVTRNKLNPIAPVARRVAKAAIRAPGGKGRGVAAPSDNGYWNMIAGAIFLLFFLYIVAHNELQTWANILLWSPSPPVQVQPPGSAAASGAGANIASGAAIGAAQASALGMPSWFGALSGGLQRGMLEAPALIGAIPNAVTGNATPNLQSGSGPGGVLGSGFWNGPVGSMLKRFGYGK